GPWFEWPVDGRRKDDPWAGTLNPYPVSWAPEEPPPSPDGRHRVVLSSLDGAARLLDETLRRDASAVMHFPASAQAGVAVSADWRRVVLVRPVGTEAQVVESL